MSNEKKYDFLTTYSLCSGFVNMFTIIKKHKSKYK